MTIVEIPLPAAVPALDVEGLWVVLETAVRPADGTEPAWMVGFASPVSITPFQGDTAADIAEAAAREYAADFTLEGGFAGLLVQVAVERREHGHLVPRPLATSSIHTVR